MMDQMEFSNVFQFTLVPRAREEAVYARATPIRYKTRETIGRTPCDCRRNNTVSFEPTLAHCTEKITKIFNKIPKFKGKH